MKTPVPETGKSTDKATLKSLKTPFTETILEYRHYSKLISGFTEPLPTWLSKKDGKLHASFNQMGKEENNVRTGRFSSTDPNLQQIPSRERAMRMIFKASPGYSIVGADYSQQEPRLLASLCDEKNLIKTYNEGKDLYATIGSFIFHKNYWECMEHWEDGSANPEGGKIRKKCKQIVLGITYGMGAKLMASNLGISIEECKDILNEFFKMFPTIKQFMIDNEQSVKEKGFVEDYIGRRRHLPDANLVPLEIEAKKNYITDSDVFIDCTVEDSNIELIDDELTKIWEQKWEDYQNNPHKGFNFYDIKKQFKELAKNSGIDTFDNGAFISKALTQCTNARIQGSAATLTKKAMVEIFNDKEMQDLGYRILIPVHDELLGECPINNVKEVEKRLSYLMINAAKPECSVSMKVDTYTVSHWYADEVFNSIHDKYNSLIKEGVTDAFQKLSEEYSELSKDVLKQMCEGTYDTLSEDL